MTGVMKRTDILLAVFMLSIFGGFSVHAEESISEEQDPHHEEDGHSAGDEHEGGHRFFVGAKGSYLAGFAEEETHHFGGGGLFFEVLAVPHWLEIELFVRVMGNSHGVILPIDLLLKVPVHINDVFHPFIGLGPTVVPSFIGDAAVHFGGVVALGSYFWVSPSFAIVAELNYNLVYEHGLVHEAGVNVGVAYGW